MKFAIIDDSPYKIEALQGIVGRFHEGSEIRIAKSFQSALSLFEEFSADVVLMDMSLPTSERLDGRPSGRNRIYGGQELMAEMDFLGINSQVVIVSQFEKFNDRGISVDLDTLLANLKIEFPNIFAGGVYYSTIDSGWAENLVEILNTIAKP